MHIVQFCPTPYAIPPQGYGGTERVVYWLARAQHLAGHKVTLIAHPASTLHEEFPGIGFIAWTGEQPLAPLLPADADVVHLHRIPSGFEGLARPWLVTEHSNRRSDAALWPNTVFVGESHARLHGRSCAVPNGVPVEDYRYADSKDRMMLSLVRMEWPQKNARTAIDLALDLNLPLQMSGKRSPWLQPKLWGAWCRQPESLRRLVNRHGYIGGERKRDLLARAAVSFHAVNWHEPAGLVVMESLASGTPVLATPNGSLPDLVRHGETGMIVSNYGEALVATRRMITMDADERRRWARRCREQAPRVETMAAGYLAMYERVVAGETLSTPQELLSPMAPPMPVVRITKPFFA